MAKLTMGQRRGLRASEFAVPSRRPGTGSWPIPDKSHARFALTQVGRSLRKGNISPSQAAAIRAKARGKLGKG